MAFLKTEAGAKLPDIQFLFNAGSMAAKPYLPPLLPAFPDTFGCRVALLRPQSRGRVELASADPRTPPRIRQNFLAVEDDLKVLRAGMRMAREVGRQTPLARFVDAEMTPLNTDAEIDAHIRATGITVHHPAGTCRMGADEQSVVDPELRVRGIDGLRVVDASVIAGPRRRQHQCAGDHDRGKGRRYDKRAPGAAAEQCVIVAPSPLAGEGDSVLQQQEWVRGRAATPHPIVLA